MKSTPFLYKKTKVGQRWYKRSIPRFIAISEDGICIKWNADVKQTDFNKEARDKLLPYTEAGLEWMVCVLYKYDERFESRTKNFFFVNFTYEDYISWKINKNKSRPTLDKLKNVLNLLSKYAQLRRFTSQKEFNDKLELMLESE